MKKWGIYILGVTILLFTAFGIYNFSIQQQRIAQISSYDECVSAGFAVMESYPPRCMTSDKRSFTQDIGNELEFYDEFHVSSPRPHQKITSPLKVTGQARGMWFFEGSFSGELFDDEMNSIGVVILQATEEWMTEEFVPYVGELVFERPLTSKGSLVIKNANPSGLKQNQKQVIIPVTF